MFFLTRTLSRRWSSRRKGSSLFQQHLGSKKENDYVDLDELKLSRYKPEGLDALCRRTKFTRQELQIMYRGFKQECPTGIVDEETFKHIYAQFFPHGDSSSYAHYIFNMFDQSRAGNLCFEDFVRGLSVLARGTLREKLQWAFNLYDLNGDGIITRDEMIGIVTAVYDMMGKYTEPTIDDNTARDHVEKIFQKMDLDKDGVISVDEFMDSCTQDETIAKSIEMFDTVF